MTSEPIKFLIVDDTVENLIALEPLLRRDGLMVLVARSGSEALELLLLHDVSLALVDVQMPVMDGFELAELMRGADRTKHVPIIFVTAGDRDPRSVFKGYESGVVDFLFKPIDPHILKSKANVFFELAHQRQEITLMLSAAARDVTELKRYEQTLRQKNVELESSNRMKSEFLANMSHELRTPLNAIIGFSELLRDGLAGDLTEQQRVFIGDICGSGHHLLSLIDDILDLSKVEAGKMTLELELVPLSQSFANCLSIIREKAATRQVVLDMEVADDLGSLHIDGSKLKQIVYNLLSNAVKFSDGGRVTLRASRVGRTAVGELAGVWQRRVLPLPAEHMFAEFLEISVTDSGIGIAPPGLEQLFKPFTQIDSRLAKRFEGTGLGLTLVKEMAELHGGTVAVSSAVGEGSCFTVWLPVRHGSEEPLPIAEPAVSVAAVDDGVAQEQRQRSLGAA